ncbi:MAG: hypothetical protein SFX73_28450 [Kofleriaceae bacterium]|nr:hypothetical protein [Kofleriaceae bacterium]
MRRTLVLAEVRMLALLAVAAACRKPTAAPLLANRGAPAGPIAPTREPEGCEVMSSDTLRVAGEPARVEVVACDLGEKPADESEPANGLTIRSWEGYVKVTRAGGRTLRTQFAEWTSGWEWGGGVGLEGPLVATSTPNDAVLVRHYANSVDTASLLLAAYAVENEQLIRVGAWSNDLMTVTFSKAHDVARVKTCVIGDPNINHAGCGDDFAADPGPTIELRWTGAKLDERTLP